MPKKSANISRLNEKAAMGLRMAERRKAIGLTQDEVSQLLQMERGTYAQYEVGRSLFPSTELPALARVLRCTVNFLVGTVEAPDEEVAMYYQGLPPDQQRYVREQLRAMYLSSRIEQEPDK